MASDTFSKVRGTGMVPVYQSDMFGGTKFLGYRKRTSTRIREQELAANAGNVKRRAKGNPENAPIGSGAAARAADKIKARKYKIDKAIRDAGG